MPGFPPCAHIPWRLWQDFGMQPWSASIQLEFRLWSKCGSARVWVMEWVWGVMRWPTLSRYSKKCAHCICVSVCTRKCGISSGCSTARIWCSNNDEFTGLESDVLVSVLMWRRAKQQLGLLLNSWKILFVQIRAQWIRKRRACERVGKNECSVELYRFSLHLVTSIGY